MVFENKSEPLESENRYTVEIHFSPGVKSRNKLLKGEPISENVTISKLKKVSLADLSLAPSGNNSSQLRRRSANQVSATRIRGGETPACMHAFTVAMVTGLDDEGEESGKAGSESKGRRNSVDPPRRSSLEEYQMKDSG